MSHVRPVLSVVLQLAWLARVTAAEPSPRAHLGVSGCASAGCHAASETGHAPWQSSFTVWATRDPHSQAHRALEGPRAERMVAAIAIRAGGRPQPPATEHPSCVACHAPSPGAALREGIGCESCHGAAGGWVVAHTLPGWTTRGNSAGMIDLADAETCARTCTPCHVGGPPRADGATFEVSHDLIAAGHPRLAFELRSFKAGTPPHWRDRVALAAAGTIPVADVDPVVEWATGRLVALEAYLDQLARQSATTAGAGDGRLADTWPELSAFDCYGCHREALAAVDRGQPLAVSRGRIRLEPLIWSLADVAAPGAAAELTALESDIERAWWLPPDPDRVRGAAGRVAATLRDRRTGDAALVHGAVERAVATTDPANWDESLALVTMLEAVVDDHRVRGTAGERSAAAARAIADVRRLLAFEVRGSGAGRVRFNSPRGHDAAAVRAALEVAADSVQELPPPLPNVR